MSRPCRQTLLEGTSLQSKQTNKQTKKERKKENSSSSSSSKLLHLCNSPSSPAGKKRPGLPTIVCWCEGNQCYTTYMYFCEKQKSQQYLTYLLHLSLSALGSSNTYFSNLRGIPVQSSPVQSLHVYSKVHIGSYCGQAKAETTIIMTIFIIIHYHYNSSSQNRTEQNRTSIETHTHPHDLPLCSELPRTLCHFLGT